MDCRRALALGRGVLQCNSRSWGNVLKTAFPFRPPRMDCPFGALCIDADDCC